MKISNNKHISFDKFVDIALYHKKTGYYMKKNPFGKKEILLLLQIFLFCFLKCLQYGVLLFGKILDAQKKLI